MDELIKILLEEREIAKKIARLQGRMEVIEEDIRIILENEKGWMEEA